MKIAFYAPLKSPNHAVPSGDRQMARALIKALELGGHDVETVSELRSFSKTPHDHPLHQAAMEEAAGLIAKWDKNIPDLWFSYHPYYKAPDLLALEVLKTIEMPVFTAEASLATKRDNDAWQDSQKCVRQLLRQSTANFYFTDRDLPGLQSEVADSKLIHLPPFIDVTENRKRKHDDEGSVRIITVGMMRPGVKIDSYRLLAKALKHIEAANWHLTIVGDGQQRDEVSSFFNGFPAEKIQWAGQVKPDDVSYLLAQAQIFVWPGFGEAYGLSYLEAQAAGLPVVAQNTHGVPFVVANGETGTLVAPDDDIAYAEAVLVLIENKQLRTRLGINAANFVRNERSLKNAGLILNEVIAQKTR